MTFEEWLCSDKADLDKDNEALAQDAWHYQQERIDELNECLEQALSDLKYWEEKASALEYDKTLTGDRAV